MIGFKSSRKKLNQIGIDFLSTGVAVVHVSATNKQAGQILLNDFLPADGWEEQAQVLKQWVHHHNLQKTACVGLLSNEDCQVFQIEKPKVPEAELISAVSWKIKDLIGYNINQAVIDIYPMPDSTKNNTHHVNVVSANQSIVEQYVDTIKKSGLSLVALDINELVIKNLLTVLKLEQQSIALLSLRQHAGLINVYYESELYVSRDFKTGLDQIKTQENQQLDIDDSMLIEIQRSFDYFESYFGLGAVRKLMIYPAIEATEKMATSWQRFTSFELDFIDVNQLLAESSNGSFDVSCFSAYCAGLRGI